MNFCLFHAGRQHFIFLPHFLGLMSEVRKIPEILMKVTQRLLQCLLGACEIYLPFAWIRCKSQWNSYMFNLIKFNSIFKIQYSTRSSLLIDTKTVAVDRALRSARSRARSGGAALPRWHGALSTPLSWARRAAWDYTTLSELYLLLVPRS